MLPKRRNLLPVLLALAVAAWFPQDALANAGTPLMWAGAFHLFIGNTLIGLGEGLLISRLFGRPKLRCVGIMILANYFSAWVGMFVLARASSSIPMDITNGWMWYWILVVATFGMTLILEWPFAAWCFRGSSDWARRSIRATVVAQAISYAVVFGLYWQVSKTTLFTGTKVVAAEAIPLPEDVVVYYIAEEDGAVYKRRLGASSPIQKVFSPPAGERLVGMTVEKRGKTSTLMAHFRGEDGQDQGIVVQTPLQGIPGVLPYESWAMRYGAGPAPKLGSASESPWEFSAGFWAAEGLRGENKKTFESIHCAYETPVGMWVIRYAHHLPGDKVLFNMGDGQICVFDPVTWEIALLWRGWSPLAVIEK